MKTPTSGRGNFMKTIDLQAMADVNQEKSPESTFDTASVLLDPKNMDQPEEFVQEIVETLDEIADPSVIPVLVQALSLPTPGIARPPPARLAAWPSPIHSYDSR